MAKAKSFVPSPELAAILNEVKPAILVMSTKEKAYFKGLTRRGYSQEQVTTIIKKAGYAMPDNLDTFFKVFTKEEKAKNYLVRQIAAAKRKEEKNQNKVAVKKTIEQLESELAAMNSRKTITTKQTSI